MLKYIESTGRTEEYAIEAALKKLGMDRDDVSVEVLERAKTDPAAVRSTPHNTPIGRPDEVAAARSPKLRCEFS